jgi:histidinol-phosphate phosphatase family protein
LPTSQLMKALFLDLDWTVIRPKITERTVMVLSSLTPNERKAEAFKVIKLPKFADEVEYFEQSVPRGFVLAGLKYRNRFPTDCRDWELMPGILPAIERHWAAGDMLIIITNQGGIEAKYHTQAEVEYKLFEVIAALVKALSQDWPMLRDYERTAFFLCPTNDPTHSDRKPNPGMLFKAERKHDIDLSASLFVGDMETDQQAAEAAGVKYIDVKDFIAQADVKE